METENNNSIQFLDTQVTKSPTNFAINVYRKPTFSGLGTSFFSFCPFVYKINSIKNFVV